MVGFLGPNGAGKTTTLKMLSGILHPSGGKAAVLGFTPWERKKAFKMQFAIVMGQKNQLWWDLPANESLYLNKCIYEIDDATYQSTLGELTELLDVKDLLNVQVRRLSLGERMKMELIAALIHKPRLIFLDEPTIGLDILSTEQDPRVLQVLQPGEKGHRHPHQPLHGGCGRPVQARDYHQPGPHRLRRRPVAGERGVCPVEDHQACSFPRR